MTDPFLGSSPMTVCEMTVLPEPDLPTSATVLPAGTRNDDALDDFGHAALHGEADPQVLDPQDVRSSGSGAGSSEWNAPGTDAATDGLR